MSGRPKVTVVTQRQRPEILVIHESVGASITKDVFTFVSLTFAVSIGVALGSVPLQWIAGVCWVLFVFGWATKATKKTTFYSVEDARKRLDEIEAGK